MMKLKTLLAVLLSLCMVLCAVACGEYHGPMARPEDSRPADETGGAQGTEAGH